MKFIVVIVNALIFIYFFPLVSCYSWHHSVNGKEKHIELSLLPEDTGMPSILPESLGLPRYDAEEEKRKADDREKREQLKVKTKRRIKSSESEQVWM